MFLTIGNVLDGEGVAQATSAVAQLEWRDGAHTAGYVAKRVKRKPIWPRLLAKFW